MIVGLALAAALSAGDAERGERLAGLAGCASCHTAEGGAPYAGGYAIPTRFGTFHGPNITPDPTHGIGGWTEADFARALDEGRAEGHGLWPAFPFTSYTLMVEADVADLWAYLVTIPADPSPSRDHEIRWPYGGILWGWRLVGFRERDFEADPERSASWNRGAYLVQAVGHCGECHTPRSALGTPKKRRALAGTDEPPERAPNITPHEHGIGGWSEYDLGWFLETGSTASGDEVGGEMRRLVRDGTARMSAEDRAAMVEYLLSVEPRPSRPAPLPESEDEDDEDEDDW